ncbi:MAG: hypothetical protein JSR33_13930 [Proteobacteria bacterium]|nr:hypothetical protein [Pseudomonadota bacterium]
MFIQINSTAKDFPENSSTLIHNETASNENNFLLAKAFQNLDMLSQLPCNWDSHNGEKPSIKAINQAKLFFISFKNFFSHLPNVLSSPNITANSEGDVVLEWWFNEKKLTIYITSEQISYIKVAGERIEDMEDGLLVPQNPNQLEDLFFWLIR